MEEPLVSVIVPVYNVEAYLPHCLRSIAEQSYQNLEIILVDDGSTDRSGDLCEEYAVNDSRARVIHQRNTGLWAARNTGHDAAHGEYLFFPDADDYFNRDMIRLLVEAINSRNGYDMAICRITITEKYDEDVSSPLDVICKEIDRNELFRCLFSKDINDLFATVMWNKLFRRSIIEDIRTNDYARSQDKDYMIRLFPAIEKVILIENTLYNWVQHEGSLTKSENSWNLYYECRTRICYRNFMNISESGREYSPYLLDELYTRLLFWRDRSWLLPNRSEVLTECNKIIKDTKAAYWRCRSIPLWKRVVCIVLVKSPRLTRLLMKATGNK